MCRGLFREEPLSQGRGSGPVCATHCGALRCVARANAEARGLGERMEWHEAHAADLVLEPASFDLALCLGSSHAFGTFEQALTALAALVRLGGKVLIADPYWRQ